MAHRFYLAAVTSLLGLTGCSDTAPPTAPAPSVPATYAFPSTFVPGSDSVSYAGQTARHVLIADLNRRIGGLTSAIDGPSWGLATADEVYSYLDYFIRFDSDANGSDPVGLQTSPGLLDSHRTYSGISEGKNLIAKLAGNDAVTDHADWNGGDFKGWGDPAIASHGGGIDTPQGLVEAFLRTLAARAIARADGVTERAPDGDVLPVHVTPEGHDLQQLIQKFLLMAVTFSQATDDYLDASTPGKGLLAPNTGDEQSAYTALEHAWDEGFGYFGAARDYANYSDEEIAAKGGRANWQGYHDSNDDGAIDLTAEYNFGASLNAAKRDLGSLQSSAPTDFSGEAWQGFIEGRAIIAAYAGGPLPAQALAELEAARDQAVAAWEGAIAATCVHYLNKTLRDIRGFGVGTRFVDYAKHWSELKGFSLGLQFNPNGTLSADTLLEIQNLIGDQPVHPSASAAAIDAYAASLVQARTMFMDGFGFPGDLAGDENGEGGW